MASTYVIPDIHGRADLLHQALAEISARRPGTVVLLGDYVDKGPNSNGVIMRLMALDPARTVALKGNHDAMMVAALRQNTGMAEWLSKGGDTTVISYGGDAALVPPTHINWLDARPTLHIDTHRVYVHAGLDPDVPAAEQQEKVLLWKRYANDDGRGYFGRHIVHGHDNIADGPLLLGGRTNLDTRAWETGRLVIGIFDDHAPGGPVDTITVRGPAL